jgi:cytochrome c oxidase cbb3-type subunit 4
MDYHIMRSFADSWGLLAMLAFFIAVSAFASVPAASRSPKTHPAFR